MSYSAFGRGGGGGHGGGDGHHGGGGRGRGRGARANNIFIGNGGGGWGPGYWGSDGGLYVVQDTSENPCSSPAACLAYQAQQAQRIAGLGLTLDTTALLSEFNADGWKWFASGMVAAYLLGKLF